MERAQPFQVAQEVEADGSNPGYCVGVFLSATEPGFQSVSDPTGIGPYWSNMNRTEIQLV
jgi:hypothetical protein